VNGHGGARTGAGRSQKWGTDDVLKVGQACEHKWSEASKAALASRLVAFPHADKIRTLHEGVQAIPVSQRKAWLAGDAYEDHVGDLEAWLHARAGTPFDNDYAAYQGAAPRVMTISAKPPRGTRQSIIREVAGESGLSESVVDNLWQKYRRFVRGDKNDAISPIT